LVTKDEKNITKAEVDILLVNTEWAMAVEVKNEVDPRDVAFIVWQYRLTISR
jgi:hypothetical protein